MALPVLDMAAEGALLRRVRQGGTPREQALAELFRAYRQPVLALCATMTGNAADAEDALQETFVAVSRAMPGFRGDSRVSTWLYRIAIRAALEIKARNRRPMPWDPGTSGASLEREILARDEANCLIQAMARLPAEQRVVLSLFALEGLRHREIAEILGVPEGTVWSRLNVARRKLAEEVSGGGQRDSRSRRAATDSS
jgi:RNA polymerase sigma-70 factor (ECF subfamily)